jgi:predicted nucleic acid-binding Zn ribbon protein
MKLDIGQKLFKLNGTEGLYSYTVKEISIMKDNDKVLETYVVECQNCSHGYNCLVRIGEDKDNRCENGTRFKYLETLTDDDENTYYYHHNDGFYYTDEKKAYEVLKEKILKAQEKRIEELEARLKNEKRIYENYILFFENKLKKQEEK